jgi:hypothetical protein
MKDVKQFILRLTALTREFGIAIGGCGCCGSPYLTEAKNTEDINAGYAVLDSQVQWVDSSNTFLWSQYSNKIIKE